jgi:hypothetical protein
MVGKCEQQRSLIIGSPSGYRVALIDIPRLFFRAEFTQVYAINIHGKSPTEMTEEPYAAMSKNLVAQHFR